MTPKALILAANGIQDCHLLSAYYALLEEGMEFDVAGPRVGTVVGEHGYAVAASASFSQIEPTEYDLLIVPGLNGREHICLDPNVSRVVAEFIAAGKAIAPFCHQGRLGMHVLGLDAPLPAGAPAARLTGRIWQCPDGLPESCRLVFQVLRQHRGCAATAQVAGTA